MTSHKPSDNVICLLTSSQEYTVDIIEMNMCRNRNEFLNVFFIISILKQFEHRSCQACTSSINHQEPIDTSPLVHLYLLLCFSLVCYSCSGLLYSFFVCQVIVANWLQILIQFIDKWDSSRNVQFNNIIL